MKDYTKNKELLKTNGFSMKYDAYHGAVTYGIKSGTTRIGAQFTLQELTHPMLRKNVSQKLRAIRNSVR